MHEIVCYQRQATEVGLKREIVLLASEKRLKDFYHMVDVRLIVIHLLKDLSKRVHRFDVQARLDNALLNAMKYSSDNGQVRLQPRGIRWATK